METKIAFLNLFQVKNFQFVNIQFDFRMSSECLRTGDKAQVLFRFDKKNKNYVFIFSRFVKHPEYLKEGQRLVFREGRTKAVGNVNKVRCGKRCLFSRNFTN